MGLSLAIGGMGHAGGLALRGMLGGSGSTPTPPTAFLCITYTAPLQVFISGEKRPLITTFTEQFGTALSPTAITFTILSAVTLLTMPGYDHVTGYIKSGTAPASAFIFAANADTRPAQSNFLPVGSYVYQFAFTDDNEDVWESQGSLIVVQSEFGEGQSQGEEQGATVTITSDYTVPSGVSVINIDARSGDVTVTIPSPAAGPSQLTLKRLIEDQSNNTVTVQAAGGALIEGAPMLHLSMGASSDLRPVTLVGQSLPTVWEEY